MASLVERIVMLASHAISGRSAYLVRSSGADRQKKNIRSIGVVSLGSLFENTTKKNVSVAVIGAGAAGLSALRLLARCASSSLTFNVTAFEQTSHIGGTWFYTDCVGTDEQGLPVYSSMYKSLRTNLPKECMAYPDFPFPSNLPSFVKHEDVQKYLEDYATHFDLWKLIKFQKIVENVKPIPDDNNKFGFRWEVTTADVMHKEEKQREIYDAVLVCNGYYAKPVMPDIPGLETFEGHLIHSHDYREPSAYVNKVVVVLGAQSSGLDISVEVSSVATQVYLCHDKARLTTYLPPKVNEKPGVKHCHKRVIEFYDGSALEVDALILCTGYHYDLHFLDESIGIKIEDGRISPLFKHFLAIGYPSLGIIGILKYAVPLPSCYLQIQYFRSILDGSGTLPSDKEMAEDEEEFLNSMKDQGLPQRYVHVLFNKQFEYWRQLADLGNLEKLPPVLERLYLTTHKYRSTDVTTYRNINFVMSDDGENFKIIDQVKKN